MAFSLKAMVHSTIQNTHCYTENRGNPAAGTSCSVYLYTCNVYMTAIDYNQTGGLGSSGTNLFAVRATDKDCFSFLSHHQSYNLM